MRISAMPIAVPALGAMLALIAAVVAVDRIEAASQRDIAARLIADDLGWASVSTDGLRVVLSGAAPTEAERLRALGLSREAVDPRRVIDAMDVDAAADIAAPEFFAEILRSDNAVSVIGLIPAASDSATDSAALIAALVELSGETRVTDLLETAAFPPPDGWAESIRYAIAALAELPRSRISVQPGTVAITAITDSAESRARLERALLDAAPPGLDLVLDLSAPRPVIAPFALRYLINDGQGRLDACSADSEDSGDRILRAAEAAGRAEKAECTIGLGRPSPEWGKAAATAMAALAEIGDGAVSFSNADVTLIASDSTPKALFERVIAKLEADLPDGFSLHAVLPETIPTDGAGAGAGRGAPEFIATLSPEGLLQLRGRVPDDLTRTAAESYAHARFGMDNVHSAIRPDDGLPPGWSLRVLAALEAMSLLSHGHVVVQPEFVELRGATGRADARAEIFRILSDRLGQARNFTVEVTYVERPDPRPDLPTPEECVARINAILAGNKIVFDPGSADIPADAGGTMTALADQVRTCEHVKMEVGGHTDSQGREAMNLDLSQARADAVLNALLARRVLTAGLTARGYGETRPIADNGAEAGREANRRIAFTLIGDDAAEDGPDGADGADGPDGADGGAATGDAADTEGIPDEQN